ncbi:N-formylglutamate amidohydrolase [uncultured Roseobacter sp.]|uniref:N-formylglutamate amidohydrolase n=1 Tax=uncultured Roseobacter sp. TaxID=114847 RepID=UPI00261EF84F|nr:N-formylglutamate amidohydrolase [uncultured Roseobacter sp.]
MTPENQINAVVESAIVTRPAGASGIVLVCEHASNHFPETFGGLGLDETVRGSHAAWDPGALAVAEYLSEMLEATLVAGGVSRLIYDCNRPPEAASAIPERSEAFDIPGNIGLSAERKQRRARQIYDPFHATVSELLDETHAQVMITVHSFTRVYLGKARDVEVGVLHDADSRLADAMLEIAGDHTSLLVARNQPYGPGDGVMHTLKRHGIGRGIPHVMLEVRNDLIATPKDQQTIAAMLAGWLKQALASVAPDTSRA